MPLAKMEFKPGVSKDDSGLANEGGFVDADKVRFRQGRAQTVGGWSKVNSSAATGVCRGLISWAGNDGVNRIGMGTHSKLYAYVAGGLYDITPVGLAAGLSSGIGGSGYGTGTYGTGTYGTSVLSETFPRTWSLATWGEKLLASPREGKLYEWSLGTGTPAAEIVAAPDNIGSMFVTSERIVVCCGCVEYGGASYDPLLVRWSAQEDNTVWTPSATNQAGEFPLSIGGRIVRGLPSRKTNLIWTDSALYAMTYLGDPLLVYGFELLGQGCGLIGPNAVAEKDGTAFWMSRSGEFYTYSGGTPQPLACSVQRYVADNLDWRQADKVYAGTNSAHSEIWWFYPDSRDGSECSRYVAYNYAEGTWTVGSWDRTAWADAGVLQYPIATDSSGYLYYHEIGHTADGGAITAYVESAPLDLADGEQLLSVMRAVPDVEDLQGGMTLTFKGKRWPAGSETEHGPYTVLATTEKIDFRMTARQMALRVDSASAPSFWRLGALRLDLRPTGSKR